MARGRAEIELSQQPQAVWDVVGDFSGIGKWMPGIESCVVDGDERIIKMMGMNVTERLEGRDDDARTISYRIVGGVPVVNHKATISVTSAGSGCLVVWDLDVDPDDLAGPMQSMYQQALEALKGQLEG